MLRLENNKAFSVWSAQFVGEYLLHPVILRMMVNKETLTRQFSFSLFRLGSLASLGAERLMRLSSTFPSLFPFICLLSLN